jgi:flagellar basal-body rod protein FlgB
LPDFADKDDVPPMGIKNPVDRREPMSLSRIFGPHSSNLDRALDRTSSRFGVLSTNLANANVPGYQRRDMDFSISLDGAQTRLAGPKGRDGEIRVDRSSVDVEREVVTIAETEARYGMLVEMTSRHFSGLKTVIREGR